MVSMLQEIDISQMFNHFAQKRCANHQKRKASSVCLHENCWKLESDKAFFCEDCNMDHTKKHGNSLRFDVLFTDELFEELDEYSKNANTKDKLKERIRKFDQKINDLHKEIEQWTRYQFAELKRFFESHFIEADCFERIENLKKMLSEARTDLSLNYELKENVNTYCTQIQSIQNELNEVIYGQLINDEENDDKINEEWKIKFKKMENSIKENVKNQVDQLAESLVNCNKKGKPLRMNESIIKEVSISEIKMPMVIKN